MTRPNRFSSLCSVWRRLLPGLVLGFFGLMVLAGSFGLSGCSSSDSDESGEVVIGLTDAEGDFVTYTVDVLSLTLTKVNGTVVETLPLSTRVDFAQYTEMTEFVTAATIPSGVYTRATITLDYQNADIRAENADGKTVVVDTIQDENGDEIITLQVSVHLEDANSLLIAPGIPAHLTLDFDLNASNHVEFDGSGSAALIVEPVLLADVNSESLKVHRLRGPLREVDVDEGTFRIIIRPFRHFISHDNEHFGTLEVTTTESTTYDINGELYDGQAGLIELDGMPTFTAVVVVGDLKFHPVRFEAREVYAGSSVPGGDLDVITGNVTSREGDVVTVNGATLIRAGGSVVFNDSVTVLLGENTRVSRQLSPDQYHIDDISVGQRVVVFGTLNDDETELDATEGYARMLLTTLRGTVVTVDVGTSWLTVDLDAIDARRASIFDFQGTGTDTEHDADPANYEINTDTLDLSSLSSAPAVKVRGFVQPFGEAPEDFDAQTVIDVSSVNALMKVSWHPATNNAFESLSAEGIELNMEGVGFFHHLGRSGVVIDLTALSLSPSVEPNQQGEGHFLIVQNRATKVYFTFDGFVTDLIERIGDGAEVRHFMAKGAFDDATAAMTSDHVRVKLD